jgi:CDP-2,3-bis-(O-geranylgeranyl)-sn-glycerol synthase
MVTGAWPILQALILILVANGTPVMATWLLRSRGNWPIDGGRMLADGRPLLGPSKSWRGLALAVAATTTAAALLGLPASTGASVGATAMLGDLASSFLKRRLALSSGSRAPMIDQVPEALLPLLLCQQLLGLSLAEVLIATALFALLDVGLSPLLFRLGIRARPY